MARKLKSDRVLFLATLLLVGLSVVMVYSASAVQATLRNHDPQYFLKRQAAYAVAGLLLFFGVGHIDFEVESALDPWFRFPVRKMIAAAYVGGNWSFELPWGRILHTY